MNNILNSLKDIATAVMYAAEARELDQVLERIAQISRDLIRARYAALGVPDEDGGLKHFKFVGMSPEEIAKVSHLPKGKGLLGAIMQERHTIRLEHMSEDRRSGGFCEGHPHMTSLLGVPIQVGQQLFGVLYLCDRVDGRPFDEEDQWLIETMAGYAALAIAGSHLIDQQRRLTLLKERERIGMELHDSVIQSLYALGMQLDLMRSEEHIQSAGLNPVINGLNEVIEDIRRYILNLKSWSDHQKTVQQYLEEMIQRLHIPKTLQIHVDAPDQTPPFTPATFEAVSLIIYEAISNAVRHANATRIEIIIRQTSGTFQILIIDDGRGFNPDQAASEDGLGLRNIQQRARLYGGTVQIQTAPGQGTALTINIPL